MRLIDADAISYDQLLNTGNKKHPFEWAASRSRINNVPTIDAKPVRHGKWIFNPKDAIEMMFTLPICSECGAKSSDGGNYCHNCGAKMDKVKNETH